jgi:hypothetical protein
MPISKIQADVLREIALNRSPESYVAGATILHRGGDSPRYSQDLDLFHDLEEAVAASADIDAKTLQKAGYQLTWLLRTPTFHRAVVEQADRVLKLEWAQDSAFRFFPIQKDELCGYRLHAADAAVNKVLALAGRDEVRDFVDILHLHDTYLSLGAMAWAACGKDPGYTPGFLLDQAGRHVAYSQVDIEHLNLRVPLNLQTMKRQWFGALERAKNMLASLPADELGCLYLDSDGYPVTPDPSTDQFAQFTRHWGSVRGAWPTIKEDR